MKDLVHLCKRLRIPFDAFELQEVGDGEQGDTLRIIHRCFTRLNEFYSIHSIICGRIRTIQLKPLTNSPNHLGWIHATIKRL